MKIFPAIDLLEGHAVRLAEGKREHATVYHADPVALVSELAHAGVDRLHVVDLDGAFDPARRQIALVSAIAAACGARGVPVEAGGGVRDRAAIDALIASGVALVVLGTAAVRDPALVEAACRDYPGRIVVAVDARDGVVAVDGWTTSGGITARELGARAAAWGAAALLYTDVARDGLRGGANVEATVALQRAVGCEVIASGGVGTLDDLRRLRDAGVGAVVVGRAIYERAFTVAEAVAVAHGAVA